MWLNANGMWGGAFHYAKPTDQRSEGIPDENGTTFSIKPGQPIGMALNCHFLFLFQIP